MAATVIMKINKIGRDLGLGGVFHGAIQIENFEWSFGYCEKGTGVYCVHARENPMYQFRESLDLGPTLKAKQEIKAILHALKTEWQGSTYDLLGHNCCHFCEAFSAMLEVKPIPAWVNRFATGADATVTFTHDAVNMARNVTSSIRTSAASSLGWLRENMGRMMNRTSVNGIPDHNSASCPALQQQGEQACPPDSPGRQLQTRLQGRVSAHMSAGQVPSFESSNLGPSSVGPSSASGMMLQRLGGPQGSVERSACSESRFIPNQDSHASDSSSTSARIIRHLKISTSNRVRQSASGAATPPSRVHSHSAKLLTKLSIKGSQSLGEPREGGEDSDAETPIFSRAAVAGVMRHREGMVGGQLDSDSGSEQEGEDTTPKCLSRQACLDFSMLSNNTSGSQQPNPFLQPQGSGSQGHSQSEVASEVDLLPHTLPGIRLPTGAAAGRVWHPHNDSSWPGVAPPRQVASSGQLMLHSLDEAAGPSNLSAVGRTAGSAEPHHVGFQALSM